MGSSEWCSGYVGDNMGIEGSYLISGNAHANMAIWMILGVSG
jgi:hypothetical protein